MRYLFFLMMLLVSHAGFAGCPIVDKSNVPSILVSVKDYSIYFYIQDTLSSSDPATYQGTTVVLKDGVEVLREGKIRAEDDWFGFFSAQGENVGFAFDSYSKEFGSAWINLNGKKIGFDKGSVQDRKPIVCQ